MILKDDIGAILFMGGMGLIIIASFITMINNMVYDVQSAKVCEPYDMVMGEVMDTKVCIDGKGDAHFINIECESTRLFVYDCKARFISPGEVRVR